MKPPLSEGLRTEKPEHREFGNRCGKTYDWDKYCMTREIMDDDKLRRDEHASVMRSRNLFLGVTLIVVGVLWMMNNLELLPDSLFDVVFSWQMLLVLIGGYLLALRKWLAGGIVAAVGLCLLLIDQLDWRIPLDKIAVPMILIAVGLSVVFGRRKCA